MALHPFGGTQYCRIRRHGGLQIAVVPTAARAETAVGKTRSRTPGLPTMRRHPGYGGTAQTGRHPDRRAGRAAVLKKEANRKNWGRKTARGKPVKKKTRRRKGAGGTRNGAADALCAAQASLTMDEDDYHRIKAAIGRRCQQERRKRTAKAKPADKTYRVVSACFADMKIRRRSCLPKVSNPIPFDGALSLGNGNSRNAWALQTGLFAGFGVSILSNTLPKPTGRTILERVAYDGFV